MCKIELQHVQYIGRSYFHVSFNQELKFLQALSRYSYLIRHSKSHGEQKSFTCEICEKVLKGNLGSYKSHLSRHDSTRYNCPKCSKTYNSKYDMKKHEKREHTNSGKKIQCPTCDKVYASKSNLKVHIKIKHSNIDTWKCDLCGKEFASPSGLAVHKKLHEDKNIKCDLCDKEFKSLYKKNRHTKIMHIGNNTKHKCKICQKSFSKSESAKRCRIMHERKVTGEKPFVCECGKRFPLDFYLKQHKQRCKEHISSKTVICNMCPKSFSNTWQLDKHKTSAHAKTEIFGCDICPYHTQYKSNLRVHKKSHNKNK